MTSVVDSAAAQSVAEKFVRQYYEILLGSPAEAYKFYDGTSDDSSVLSWPGVTVSTIEKIKDLIMSQDYQGCQALVETIHGQPSQSGGVIVQVTGTWRAKETSTSFCETFFLAYKGRGSYYVLNDIFRFVDREPPVVASGDKVVVQAPEAVEEKLEALPNKIHHAAVSQAAAEALPKTSQVVNKKETLSAEKISYAKIATKEGGAQVAAGHKVVVVAPSSTNYKDRLVPATSLKLKENNNGSSVHNSKVVALINDSNRTNVALNDNKSKVALNNNNNNNNNNGAPTNNNINVAPNNNNNNNGVPTNNKVALNNNNNKGDRAARTIYFWNLPWGVYVDEIWDTCKKSFGRVRRGGVTVMYDEFSKDWSDGFVEFETATSAIYAIRTGKIHFGKGVAYITKIEDPNHGRSYPNVGGYNSSRGRSPAASDVGNEGGRYNGNRSGEAGGWVLNNGGEGSSSEIPVAKA